MDRSHDERVKRRILARTKVLVDCIFDPKYTFSTVTREQTNFPPRPTIVKDENALGFTHRIRRLKAVPTSDEI